MDWKNQYNLLIETRKNRILNSNEIYEKHHILPISLGGKNSKDNIVHLTYREHFIAHKFLFLFCEGKDKMKMGYALHRLCSINNNTQQYRIKSSRDFAEIKTEIYEFIRGENHPFYGYKWTDEQKKEISERQKGVGNSMYGKNPWNKGLSKETDERLKIAGAKYKKKYKEGKVDRSNWSMSIEGRENISKAQKGKPKTDECKRKLSKFNTGKKLSSKTKEKMSIARKGIPQKKIKCPYCGKEGGTTMYRWHFNNCKKYEKRS